MTVIEPRPNEKAKALAARVLLQALEHEADIREIATRGRDHPESLSLAETQLLGACVVAREGGCDGRSQH